MPAPIESADPVAELRSAGVTPGTLVGLATPSGGGTGIAVHGPHGARCSWTHRDVAEVAARLVGELGVRLVWWAAGRDGEPARELVAAGVRAPATWDVTASHRLLHGGFDSDPGVLWAVHAGRPPGHRPRSGQLDLLGGPADDDGSAHGPEDPTHPWDPVRPDGYLRPGWSESGPPTPEAAAAWAGLARAGALAHLAQLAAVPDGRASTVGQPRPAPAPPIGVLTAWSESAAELLAVELEATGLPIDRVAAVELLTERIGPRPTDSSAATAARAARDATVLDLLPESGVRPDLRNPAQVRELLTRIGVDVPDTRSWRLEPLREAHPLVAALLAWRKAERIATTYGWTWLDRHVGADGRLRGSWTGCDGAAGRMTASAGLHNLPAELRPAVAAEPGHVLVRADLGQVEPRVLAAVSGDQAFAAAAAAEDLYAPVAGRLGCDRPTAKVAVLAAMYGQTSGTAGEALRGLERAYPVAMTYLRAADERGRDGEDVRTYGGRRVRMWQLDDPTPPAVAARGRFARNAVVQGAAAELFKMWAVSVRAGLPSGAEIVLCLHDELLVHAPIERSDEVQHLLHDALQRTAGRWAAGSGVRFVAEVGAVQRWSDAKG